MTPAPKRIVICGGGIIGASTAYYLSELASTKGAQATITVVEREHPACAASGKAGGFLARDWNDGSPLQQLSRLSYRLHAELAQTFGADTIGHRQVHTLQVLATPGAKARKPQTLLPEWVDGDIAAASKAGDLSSTAQVMPRLLTEALLASAGARGTTVVKGTAEGLERGDDGRVRGVLVDGRTVEADAVVLAMGPWTPQAEAWLPKADLGSISGLKYHSVVLRPQEPVGPYCLEGRVRSGSRDLEAEVYPRPDGTVYVCGEPQQDVPVPPTASEVSVETTIAQAVRRSGSAMCSRLAEGAAELVTQQACYLPVSRSGLPLIGEVPGEPGVYLAAGHSCWGILNGPATGKVIAELILEGRVSCLPKGLGPLQPRSK